MGYCKSTTFYQSGRIYFIYTRICSIESTITASLLPCSIDADSAFSPPFNKLPLKSLSIISLPIYSFCSPFAPLLLPFYLITV